MCGSESRTIRKEELTALSRGAGEIATLWTARKMNKSVIEEIQSTNPLDSKALINNQQLSYFGHIM